MDYVKITGLDELDGLEKKGRKIYFLAGGTDLMVQQKDDLLERESIMADISSLKDLKSIRLENSGIRIGALTTFTEILESRLIREQVPLLFNAAQSIGSPQIRNRATLAGNIANASPAADSIPALFVHEARIRTNLAEYPVNGFFQSVKRSILKNSEMILEIVIPRDEILFRSFYFKSGPRQALAIAKASLAARINTEQDRIKNIRLACGAVGITVIRPVRTEKFLLENKISRDIINHAKDMLRSEIAPIDDFRSTGTYRSGMIAYFLEKALTQI
ncbi:MAG: FAD binding domain-containing protein [bacterium]|nr:FAD binding domain-containing protein [bacterium]